MDGSLLTSIIVCTKNRRDELNRFFQSLDKQTLLPDELIVVDASYGNETFELVDRWFQRSKYLIKRIKAKPGLTRQTNIGIRNSGGRYLFFFDDDVVLDSKFIQVVYETFMKLEEQNIGDITGRITNTLGKQFD